MADITTISTFVAAFTWKQFFRKAILCDLERAETRLEMKQSLGVLPHRRPLDTYWGGLTCLDLGERGRRQEGKKRSRADGGGREQKAEIIKSTIGRVGQWQGKGTGVTDMNRQMYVCRQTLRQTVMELFGSLLRQTHWALYFPDTKCWPSFIGCDSHCRAKKQSPPSRAWLPHSVIRQVPL